jgi:hypothetical protein
MDRFTWAVVGAVVLLAAVAFGMVAVNRVPEGPPDLATADGTVRAYIAAVHDRRGEDAWRLLEGPSAVGPPGRPNGTRMSEAEFQRELNSVSRSNDRRIRVLPPRQAGDTTNVDVEIVSTSDAPFFVDGGSSSRRVTFSLRQAGEQWRITAAPSAWEIG